MGGWCVRLPVRGAHGLCILLEHTLLNSFVFCEICLNFTKVLRVCEFNINYK